MRDSYSYLLHRFTCKVFTGHSFQQCLHFTDLSSLMVANCSLMNGFCCAVLSLLPLFFLEGIHRVNHPFSVRDIRQISQSWCESPSLFRQILKNRCLCYVVGTQLKKVDLGENLLPFPLVIPFETFYCVPGSNVHWLLVVYC